MKRFNLFSIYFCLWLVVGHMSHAYDVRVSFYDYGEVFSHMNILNSNVADTVENLIDFNSGSATGMDVTHTLLNNGSNEGAVFDTSVDWINPAEQTRSYTPEESLNLTLKNVLPGNYQLELVYVAHGGIPLPVVDAQVNGTTANSSYNGITLGLDAWNMFTDGTLAKDWLVWDNVSPTAGEITISHSWTGQSNSGGLSLLRLVNVCDVTVINTNDSGSGSLRQAIIDACDGASIRFHPSMSGEGIRLSSSLVINKSLNIDGKNSSITLTGDTNGDGDGQVSIFDIATETVRLSNLSLRDGFSSSNGGAIRISDGANVTISNLSFYDNRADINGGAISIENNTATDTVVTIKNSFFHDNQTTSGHGGAVAQLSPTSSGKTQSHIFSSTFDSNVSANNGGAIYFTGVDAGKVVNSTFYANIASNYGGAIDSSAAVNMDAIVNNTFSNNTSGAGQGGNLVVGGTLTQLINNISIDNVLGGDCLLYPAASITNNHHNIIEDGSCANAANITDTVALGVLQHNFGTVDTMALLPNSIASNAGDNTTCADSNLANNLDARDTERPRSTLCSIGAFEKVPPNFSSAEITTVIEEQAYSYSITTMDQQASDGASPVISAPTLPTWLTLTDNGNGTATLAGTPTQSGTNSVVLSLNENGDNVQQIFDITITPVNDAPVADFGERLNFDGVDDYAEAGLPVSDDFTLEFWLKTSQVSLVGASWDLGSGLVDADVSGVQNDFGTSLLNDKLAFGVVSDTIQSTSSINDDVWHHVAVTRRQSDGAMAIFIDGILETTGTGSTNSLDDATTLRIGKLNSDSNPFAGFIDEVRVWNVVRTPVEIEANMGTTLVGNEANLVAYWQFDDNTGTNAVDLTANANHATLSGDVTWGFATEEDTPFSGTLFGFDADADGLTYTLVDNDGGAAVITNASTGAFTYTPAADVNGTRSFSYKTSDGVVDSATTPVSVNINAVNDAPSFSHLGNQYYVPGTIGAQTLNAWAHSFNMGATDEDSTQSVAAFTVNVVSDPNSVLSGTVTVNNTGDLSYILTGNTGDAALEVFLQDDSGSINDLSTAVSISIGVGTEGIFTLSSTPSILTEGSSASLRLERSSSVAGLTVNLSASNAYITVPATANFAAAEAVINVPLGIFNDNVYEGSKTTVINVTATGYLANSLTLTTRDDEMPNVPYFDVSANIIGEGAVEGEGNYSLNSSIVLTPLPSAGWVFDSWGGACDVNGRVVMSQHQTCYALFTQETYSLSVLAEGQGTVEYLSNYPSFTTATIIVQPADGWSVGSWSQGCGNGQVLMDSHKQCQVTFVQNYHLSLSSHGRGSVTGTGSYAPNSTVSISANPAIGWRFGGWTGGCGASSVLLDGNKSCEALFVQQHNLAINVLGQGNVSGAGTYDVGTQATLNINPVDGWQFEAWSGDCQSNTILMDSDKNCLATFRETLNYQLTVEQTGEGQVIGAGTYVESQLVTLEANAADGWILGNWEGDCDNNGRVVMDADKTCQANFVSQQFELSVSITGNGAVNNAGIHPALTQISLNAVRANDSLFNGWGGDCNRDGSVFLDTDKNCSASFIPLPPAGTANPIADSDPSAFRNVTAEMIADIDPVSLSLLDAEQVEQIPVAAFQAFSSAQLANLSPNGVSGITPEQLASLAPNILSDLNASSIAALNPISIQVLNTAQVLALNNQQVSIMPSEALTGLLTNLASNAISPLQAQDLIPDEWQIDPVTGDISVPPGTPIRLRQTRPTSANSNLSYPRTGVVDLNSSLALSGTGSQPTVLTQMQSGLSQPSNANDEALNFIMTQSEAGILTVKDENNADISFAFVPDPDAMFQIDGPIRVGLEKDEGGFYSIITADGQRYRVMPAPADPEAFANLLGADAEIHINADGSVFYEIPDPDSRRRAGRSRRVLVFDPVVEPVPPEFQVCWDRLAHPENFRHLDAATVAMCESLGNIRLPNSRRADNVDPYVRYPDGRSQKITPAFLEAKQFIELGERFEGVEDIRQNANGTFVVRFLGEDYVIAPRFDVDEQTNTRQTPEIVVTDTAVTYQVPFDSKTNTRRAGRSRRVLVFDPVIEPMPGDMCRETSPGHFRCDFGGGHIVYYPNNAW